MEKFFKELKDKLDFLYEIYNSFYNKWIEANNDINFAKLNVINFKNNVSLNYLIQFKNFIEEFKQNNLDMIKKAFTSFRVKNIDSISAKINKYCLSKEKGKIPIKKCLNDIFGFRLIHKFNIDYQDIKKIQEEYKNDKNVKIKVLDKNKNYKAIHIYISISNLCLPWELQLWNEKNKTNNEKEHLKKYGRY